MLGNTDKARNGYLPTYLQLAAGIGVQGIVCELGVEDGGSLELWQTLFPEGVIVGVDSDEHARWPDGTIRVVSDQMNPHLPDILQRYVHNYSLIIDDASHRGLETVTAFRLLWPLVASGGFYVIEDWGVAYEGVAPMFDPTMADAVFEPVHYIHRPHGDSVREVRFRGGLVIVEKE